MALAGARVSPALRWGGGAILAALLVQWVTLICLGLSGSGTLLIVSLIGLVCLWLPAAIAFYFLARPPR